MLLAVFHSCSSNLSISMSEVPLTPGGPFKVGVVMLFSMEGSGLAHTWLRGVYLQLQGWLREAEGG